LSYGRFQTKLGERRLRVSIAKEQRADEILDGKSSLSHKRNLFAEEMHIGER